jgi:hypothetical protein
VADSSQKDLTMKFSAKADPSLTQVMKSLADLAADEVKKEKEYQKLLSARQEGYQTAKRLKEDLARAGIGVELSEEQKYQRLLQERIKGYQTAARLKKDLAAQGIGGGGGGVGGGIGGGLQQSLAMIPGMGGLAGAMGPLGVATAGVTALATMAIGKIQRDSDRFYHSLRMNYQTGQIGSAADVAARNLIQEKRQAGAFMQFADRMKNVFSGRGFVTDLGEEGYHRSPYGRQWDINMTEAKMRGQIDTMLMGGRLASRSRQDALKAEYVGFQAQHLEALRGMGLAQNLTAEGGSRRLAAIEYAGRNPLYNREQQIEDYHRQIGMQQELMAVKGRSYLRQKSLHTEALLSSQQAHKHAADLAGIQTQLSAKEEEHEAYRRGGGQNEQKKLQLAEQLRSLDDQRKAATEAMTAAEERTLNLRKAGELEIRASMQQQAEILRSNLETVQRARQEMARQRQQSTEQLGLMHPMQQRTLMAIGMKIQRGQALTMPELVQAQQHRDIFGNWLQREGMKRGAPVMDFFRGLSELGLGAREKEMEKRELELKQQIQIKLEVDATEALTEQLKKTLLPEVQNLMSQAVQAIKDEMDRGWRGIAAQGRAAVPEAGY